MEELPLKGAIAGPSKPHPLSAAMSASTFRFTICHPRFGSPRLSQMTENISQASAGIAVYRATLHFDQTVPFRASPMRILKRSDSLSSGWLLQHRLHRFENLNEMFVISSNAVRLASALILWTIISDTYNGTIVNGAVESNRRSNVDVNRLMVKTRQHNSIFLHQTCRGSVE
jgi:hypothetical protein